VSSHPIPPDSILDRPFPTTYSHQHAILLRQLVDFTKCSPPGWTSSALSNKPRKCYITIDPAFDLSPKHQPSAAQPFDFDFDTDFDFLRLVFTKCFSYRSLCCLRIKLFIVAYVKFDLSCTPPPSVPTFDLRNHLLYIDKRRHR